VSIAGFYKHLENYVYDQSVVVDFTGVPTYGLTPATYLGKVTTPENGQGGNIWGFEFSTSLPAALISEDLDGFGALFSASYTKSRVKETPDSDPIALPGLSRWVVNSTLYYEKNGFQARVSGRYRSSFLAEVSGLSLARDLIEARGEFLVDAQIGYEFQEGPLDGLSILLQGNNLTNEPFRTYYNGDIRQTRDYQEYGRNIMLGATYKF